MFSDHLDSSDLAAVHCLAVSRSRKYKLTPLHLQKCLRHLLCSDTYVKVHPLLVYKILKVLEFVSTAQVLQNNKENTETAVKR